MTPERMRVKIAGAVGWTDVTRINRHEFGGLVGADPKDGIIKIVPSYTRCLNAIHEAVVSQSATIRDSINHRLMEMLEPQKAHILDRVINATAPQRCEAFLRTLGLWEEGGES